MAILDFLAEFAWRALLLGTMGTIAAWALRRRGAEVQHAIWRIVLAGMLALPLMITLLPPLAILPATNVTIRAVNAVSLIDFSPSTAESSSFANASTNTTLDSPRSSLPSVLSHKWPVAVVIGYAVVAALFLGRIALALRRGKIAASAAMRVSIDLINELEYPWPEIRESQDVIVPFTLGQRNPIIVLPAAWRQWDDFKLRSVLVHELAHIHRGDWATSLAAAINRAVF